MATRAKAAPIRVKMSEEQLKNAVVDYATSLGWKVFHIPDWMYRLALMSMKRTMRNDRKWSPPGFPDLVLMQGLHDTREPARLIFVELKVEKGVFSSPVKDFYLTNPIARASAVMAECSALAKNGFRQAAE